jgi:hypothetical protein
VLTLVGRALPLGAWLAVPVLFAAAVLGLTAFFGVLLDARWPVTLSSALFGAAAVVTAMTGVGPEWGRYRRVCLRLGYPGVVFVVGLVVGGLVVPTLVAVLVGLPALVMLGWLCRLDREE